MAKIGEEDWKCCSAVKRDHKGNHFLRREGWTLPGGTQHCKEEMTPAGISCNSYFSDSIHIILWFLQDSSLSTAGFFWKSSLLLPLPLQLGELIVCEVKIRHWNDNKNTSENLECEDRMISSRWIALLLTVRAMWWTSNVRHPHVSFCLVIIPQIPWFISEPTERESNGNHRTLLVCLLLEAVLQMEILDWFFRLTKVFSRSYSTGQSLKVLPVGCCFWCFYVPKSFSVLSSHSTKCYARAAKSKGQWSIV